MEAMEEVYESMKDSIIDIASMEDDGIHGLKKFIYDQGESGDLLRLNVSVKQGDGSMSNEVIQAEFVKDSNHQIKDQNLLLPFQDGIDSDDIYFGDQLVSYNSTSNTIFVDGIERKIGDNFMLNGRNVSIARGSVVILLYDDLVREFPVNGIQEEIVSNSGSLSVGDITTTNSYLLEKKETGASTSVSSYIYFTNSITGQRVCGIENVKTVDDGITSTSSKISMSHSDGSIQDVLGYSSSSTTVRSITQVLDENTSTIDMDGISFTSDDAALLLGENSEFGIFYDESSDVLQIRHFDTVSGEYVTKREFTNS